MNPFEGNGFANREDARRAVLDIFEPLVSAYEAGGARPTLGETATGYDDATVGLESFARPLFGIVPLAAGGAPFPHWELFRQGLVRGTNPQDPQFWGAIQQGPDQRMVEMAPIGLALALVPEHIFEPLAPDERRRLLEWLEPINRFQPAPNNWWFFRVLVNLGFERVGGPVDRDAIDESLRTTDGYWLGDGWYRDGQIENTDFYNPWAFHFYGLIYAQLAADSEWGARFRDRARRFADDWKARFDTSGRVVPFGRSLTYRFGGASFWGALAFADEEALPWGQIRWLWAQHMRWWASQPIGGADGVLSIGWTYPNLLMSETYNGPGSPHWSLKAFLPLALGADHPFWSATEVPPDPGPPSVIQHPAVAVVNRDDRQVQVLNGGRGIWFMRHGSAKYGKFAYSSAFAFSLDPDDPMFANVTDSMLLLRDADGVCAVRTASSESGIDGDVVWSRWKPFPDVEVVTVLCGDAPWHARIHSIRTGRALECFEGGFAVRSVDGAIKREELDGAARVETAEATSIIADPMSGRRGEVHDLQPNTNIMYPRALVPMLSGSVTPGTHLLTSVVAAVEAPDSLATDALPAVPERAWRTLESLTGGPRDDGKPAGLPTQ